MSRRCRSGCNFSCWFCVFYMLIFFFIVGFFIFWLIFLPSELKFTVTDASLAKFDYIAAPNSTLYYSLALNLTVRNPNKKVGIYFRRVQVLSLYRKKRFSLVTLNSTAPFYQGRKSTTVLPATIQGQQLLLLKEKDMKQYDSETGLGFYSIDVQLALRVRIRYGKIKTRPFKPRKILCRLKIPLSNSINGTSTNGYSFRATSCGNVYILTSPNED